MGSAYRGIKIDWGDKKAKEVRAGGRFSVAEAQTKREASVCESRSPSNGKSGF
jgi:hypothetical protein